MGGQVSGDGIATLQFDTARRARALKGSARKLQQADATSASEFGLNVDVNALDDGPGMLSCRKLGRHFRCFRRRRLRRTCPFRASSLNYLLLFQTVEQRGSAIKKTNCVYC